MTSVSSNEDERKELHSPHCTVFDTAYLSDLRAHDSSCVCDVKAFLIDDERSAESNLSSSFLTEEWHYVQKVLQPAPFTVAAIRNAALPDDDDLIQHLAANVLAASELEWMSNLHSSTRRKEWLLGRICLKEAIRRLTLSATGINVPPQMIESTVADSGCPLLTEQTISHLKFRPTVSLSHKGGVTASLVGADETGARVGIDIEFVAAREPGFERLAFSESERELLNRFSGDAKHTLACRMWAAKEAAGKALGTGLSNNPKSIETSITPEELAKEPCIFGARAVNPKTDDVYRVYTFLFGRMVMAVTSLEIK